MVTIYEVAKQAEVSLATVSRVINGNSKVSEKTRRKVELAMETLGYKPNSIAQSLASNTSNRIGILVSVLDGPFFSNMLAVVEQELRLAGKHAIITAGHSDEEQERKAIEFLISCKCDGLILCIDALSDEYLLSLKTPFALINHQIEAIKDRCFVVDNQQGGYLATRQAIEKGHRKIGYISGPLSKEDARLRLKGHQQALAENEIDYDPTLFYEGNYKESGGREGFLELNKLGKNISALICANDDMASGAIWAAREQGVMLPQQLSVIGFDDLLFGRYTYPALTTVINPIGDMGSMSAKWILKTVYNKKSNTPITNIFPAKLKIRESLSEPIFRNK